MAKSTLTYRDAGVDIDRANALVDDIRQISARTRRPGVLNSIGGFGALFEIPEHYRRPILVSGTDGVGTKLKLATELNVHNHIGIDLVAMCVNDIACLGAEPLFFLDYFATGHLDPKQATTILTGIGQGCELAGAALIGGETAEMPGVYSGDDYDLAGFCVGVVEKDKIIDGHDVKIGDCLIAIASSGPHANGYSLIRRVIEQSKTSLDHPFEQSTLGHVLLTPTKIYIPALKALHKQLPIHAIAHITGGGLIDNLPRVLPQNTQATLDSQSWQCPEIFQWLQRTANIDSHDMFRTFNMGIGLVICVNPRDADTALDTLTAMGESAWICGHIESTTSNEASIQIK